MPGRPATKMSVQDTVYWTLKEGILSLRLPPGTAMSTQEMAQKLNVSRTPVREAFIRLHEESLVEIIPQRETLVSRIDMARAMEERFIRESLELAVLRPFLERFRPGDEIRFHRCIEDQERFAREKRHVEFLESDNEMHRLFFEVARQLLAWETLQGVLGHDYRYRLLAVRDEDIMRDTIGQHKRIVSFIEKKDLDRLAAELTHHLHKVRFESRELILNHPDYFKAESENPFGIGVL